MTNLGMRQEKTKTNKLQQLFCHLALTFCAGCVLFLVLIFIFDLWNR